MIRFFPIILLQVYCLYHAYKNRSNQFWYFLILILPLFGSLMYLYHHFYSRKNVENLSEQIKGIVKSDYEVEKLEKQLKFSETIANKNLLADKYLELERFTEAKELYEACLEGFNKDNPYIMMSLIQVNYYLKDYEQIIYYGDLLKENREFITSDVIVLYAWSFFHTNQNDTSEELFRSMDIKNSNYQHRMEFAKFLNLTGKSDEALSKVEQLKTELEQMTSYSKKLYRKERQDVTKLYAELSV